MKARLVLLGLGICAVLGQAEGFTRRHHGSIINALGIMADSLAVLIIAALVLLITYLITGHPIPGHARPPIIPPEPPRAGPLEYSAEIIKLSDGVMAGPAIALVEPGNGEEIATLSGAGELQSAHIELTGKGTGGNSSG
jgi:hypothetical protein